ncbi:MAG: hypothetical protein HON77_17385 [Gammaproteobacteria bacterium]|nr:hypothetical protein [Gammaproteobacteria bacterium]MBT6890501.1 hypothetical protein [Gammaproteobacteria bacterium]MDG1232251.1 hypothetical protein [Pseudomonadales bacterium]
MEAIVTIIVLFATVITAIFWFAPRPLLDPRRPGPQVPASLGPAELETWLTEHEAGHAGVIEGTDARIDWANGPAVTDLCFLYVHGFSASRQEIAPVTKRIADHFNANAVYARLAGHGLSENSMQATAEQWLQSMVDSWEIASRVGKKVVVIATSTGAPLCVWLNEHIDRADQPHTFIFLSPNFKVRSPFGFLLTWPWADRWVHYLIGKEHRWEPENDQVARYWTHRYSSKAIIEMQKVVDWVRKLKPAPGQPPLATFYMKDDPTINHQAAINFHNTWGADHKALHPVDIDIEVPQHVFVGDISAPQRNDWCVKASIDFIHSLPTEANYNPPGA